MTSPPTSIASRRGESPALSAFAFGYRKHPAGSEDDTGAISVVEACLLVLFLLVGLLVAGVLPTR